LDPVLAALRLEGFDNIPVLKFIAEKVSAKN